MLNNVNKKSQGHDEKILNAILKLGGHLNEFENLFGAAGNLYTLKGAFVRVAISYLICASISGVTLVFVDKNWFEDIIVASFYILFTALFVEISRFIIYKLYTKLFKKELSDIAIVLYTALLSGIGATLILFGVNKFGIHTLFINKPWPVLSLVSILLGFVIMGIMVLYRRTFGNLKNTLSEIQELYLSVLKVLSSALEIKDTYTWGHSDRVSLFATALAIEIGLEDKDIEIIKQVAIFHDIGKIGISESILRKEGPLSPEEWNLIKNHPLMSAKILEPLKYFKDGIPIVQHHHERYDGKGYPDNLSGDQIPLGARIIALADTLDAMASTRSYRQAMSLEEIKKKIVEASGSQFDPKVVEIFLRLWDKKVFQQGIENINKNPSLKL